MQAQFFSRGLKAIGVGLIISSLVAQPNFVLAAETSSTCYDPAGINKLKDEFYQERKRYWDAYADLEEKEIRDILKNANLEKIFWEDNKAEIVTTAICALLTGGVGTVGRAGVMTAGKAAAKTASKFAKPAKQGVTKAAKAVGKSTRKITDKAGDWYTDLKWRIGDYLDNKAAHPIKNMAANITGLAAFYGGLRFADDEGYLEEVPYAIGDTIDTVKDKIDTAKENWKYKKKKIEERKNYEQKTIADFKKQDCFSTFLWGGKDYWRSVTERDFMYALAKDNTLKAVKDSYLSKKNEAKNIRSDQLRYFAKDKRITPDEIKKVYYLAMAQTADYYLTLMREKFPDPCEEEQTMPSAAGDDSPRSKNLKEQLRKEEQDSNNKVFEAGGSNSDEMPRPNAIWPEQWP